MRYIYEYRKKQERSFINLCVYESCIRHSLILFSKHEIRRLLKDFIIEKDGNIVVKEDSFEFSFPGCLPQKSLQRMGKFLAKVFKSKKGFVRKNNKAFVFVSYEKEREKDEQILLEFVDSSTLDIDNENHINEVSNWIQFYKNLELSVSYISLDKAKYIFGEIEYKLNERKEVIFEVEIKHRSISYSDEDNSDNIDNFFEKKSCIIEHLYSAGLYQPRMIDLVDIISIDKVSNEIEKKIKNKFDKMYFEVIDKYSISKDNSEIKDIIGSVFEKYINVSNKTPNLLFTVHNVGQALATSIQIEFQNAKRLPLFYFDYGIACHRNKKTCKPNLSLPADKNTIILLSHIHEDHWCGFRNNKEALESTWIIPQSPSKSLLKVLADIKDKKGKILLLNTSGNNIYFDKCINNICIKAGNHNVKSKGIHETGIALIIESNKNGDKYRILVSGDQKYQNHIPSFLLDINVLVASHHGGDYGRTISFPAHNNEKHHVIYSYGKNNTYSHPSKIKDYRNKAWNNEHHTISGDYEIML